MKKTIYLSSVIAISAVISGSAMATVFTTSGGTDSVGGTFNAQPTVTVTGLVKEDIQGLTANIEELNYMSGVTSNVQTQLNGKTDATGVNTLISNSINNDGGAIKTALAGKQDALTEGQQNAVDSGITSALVTQITTNKNDITTINSSAAMTSGITAAKVSQYDGYATSKQDALTEAQQNAVDSGITSALVAQITTNKNDIATINSSAAMTSGITAAKVSQYDGYATSKQDALTSGQLSAVNSGITATDVAQITTNKNDITDLKEDVKMNASAQSSAVYGAGAKVDTAIAAVDSALKTAETNITNLQNDVAMNAASASSAGYAAGAKVDVALGLVDSKLGIAEDKIGTGTFTGSNVGTGVTDLTTAVNNLDTAIGTVTSTNYISSSASVGANLDTLANTLKGSNDLIGASSGAISGAGILNGKTIGTASGNLSIIGALETLGADAAGVTANNAFTGNNSFAGTSTFTGASTFNNSNGITIQDGSAGNSVALKTSDTGGTSPETLLEVSGADYLYGANTEFRSGVGLTVENGAHKEVFVADASGITVGTGTVDNFTVDATNGNMVAKGSATVNSLVIGTTGKGIDNTGAATLASLSFDGTNSVNAIDTGASAITTGNANTLATTATLLKSAENATYTNGVSTGSNITATTLKGAIADLDTTIGADVTGTNANVLAANSVNQNLDLLDNHMGNLSAITHTAFGGTNTNITGAMNALATNVATGMGGTFAGDGSWSASVSTGGSVNYAYSTAATNLMGAVNQVASNIGGVASASNGNIVATNTVNQNLDTLDAAIGNRASLGTNNMSAGSTVVAALNALDTEIGADSDYASTFNGVAGTNSVKANINAVNAKVGDVSTLAAGTGSTGNAITNGTGTAATTVVAALNNIDATLGQIHGLKNGNSHLQAGSNLANGTTVEEHLVSLDDAIGDRTALTSSNAAINSAVATDMATAFNTTGNLIGDMDFTGSRFLASATDLSDAVRTLDKNIERVETKLEKAEYKLKSGLAAVSALSALVPNARDCGNTQISVGTGVYGDRMGIAVGGFHYFNDHILFNAGASYGGTRDWAFRAGVTFGL